ncbi:hypothetical protein V2J09_009609 [Rumex salicifolius]
MVSTGGSKCDVRVIRTRSVAGGSRMRADQVKCGVDVSNGGGENLEGDDKAESRSPEQTRGSPATRSAVKRRIGKSDSNSVQIVGERSPTQLLKRKNGVALSDWNGKCKSPVQSHRKKSLNSASDDGDQKSVALVSFRRSDIKSSEVKESLDANGSDRSVGVADQRTSAVEKKSAEGIGPCDGEIEKGLVQLDSEKTRSDEEKEDEKKDDDESKTESEDRSGDGDINGSDVEENEEEEEEEAEERIDERIEVEMIPGDEEIEEEKSVSCDEKKMVEDGKTIYSDEEVVDDVEENISDCEDKEMNVTQVNRSVSNSELNSKPNLSSKPAIAIARSGSSTQLSPVKKQPPKFSRPTHSSPGRDSDAKQRGPNTHSTLQMDLVMWKHVPKSALVFGVGTFMIISSSYTKDLNISFISVTSYLGLIYLGISFLYKSFKCRGIKGGSDTNYGDGMVVIGEDEAIWLSSFILPVLNEFLLKLKALFCGDPAVTMKLAAVLFALARCGSSITIWNMVKLGFFVAFILPKFCSSYSAQITGYGKFWILRFQDAWRTCSHKKAVAFVMFTIVWNLSSVVARIWAAFMLFVAIRYYQQSAIKAGSIWDEVEVDKGAPSTTDIHVLRRTLMNKKLRQGRSSTTKPVTSTYVHLKEAKKYP